MKEFLKIGNLVINPAQIISVNLEYRDTVGTVSCKIVTTAIAANGTNEFHTFDSESPEGKAIKAYFTPTPHKLNAAFDLLASNQEASPTLSNTL